MSIRQRFLAIDGEISRMIRRHRFGRGLAAFVATVAAVVFGTVASAAPILSFPSQQVTADGINPTTFSVTVQADNTSGPALTDIIALTSQIIWTASGGPLDTDLTTIADDGTASTTGFMFATVNPLFDMDGGSSEPKNWSVAANGTGVPLGTGGPVDVATLNFIIGAGITSGTFALDFVTGSTFFNAFADGSSNTYLYTNGNNGQPAGTGLITVVPEASSSVILGSGALMATGVGFAQRRARRNSRKAENAG